jgi:hypothetical protein
MKISNKKIIVSTLALAMGAALAGSISGSVAWYQYSTRAAALINGTSVGTLGRLQIAEHAASHVDGDWVDYKSFDPANFRPVSITNTAGTLAWFDQPVYQVAQAPAMDSSNKGYVDYQFDFRFQTETDKTAGWKNAATRNVYLSHFAIVNDGATNDVSSAVRVAILGQDDKAMKIFEQKAAGDTTATKGILDLNKNGKDDTNYWDCQDDPAKIGGDIKTIEYTNGADSYTTNPHSDLVLTAEEQAKVYELDTTVAAKKVCTTAETLTIRVWLEGWAELGGAATWTDDYLKQNFDIQLQFMCQADR